MADCKHPETRDLTRSCYAATGCKTHAEFAALTHGAISLRTFGYWLAGARPADQMARQYLALIETGWRPSREA